jgi:chromosome segregation ATPase
MAPHTDQGLKELLQLAERVKSREAWSSLTPPVQVLVLLAIVVFAVMIVACHKLKRNTALTEINAEARNSKYKNEITTLENECESQNSRIKMLRLQIQKTKEDLNSQIADRNAQIADRNAHIADRNAQIAVLHAQIATLENECESKIGPLRSEIHEIQKIKEDLNSQIAVLHAQTADRNAKITDRNAKIAVRNAKIVTLKKECESHIKTLRLEIQNIKEARNSQIADLHAQIATQKNNFNRNREKFESMTANVARNVRRAARDWDSRGALIEKKTIEMESLSKDLEIQVEKQKTLEARCEIDKLQSAKEVENLQTQLLALQNELIKIKRREPDLIDSLQEFPLIQRLEACIRQAVSDPRTRQQTEAISILNVVVYLIENANKFTVQDLPSSSMSDLFNQILQFSQGGEFKKWRSEGSGQEPRLPVSTGSANNETSGVRNPPPGGFLRIQPRKNKGI